MTTPTIDIDDADLIAYLDDRVDPAKRKHIEAALENNASLLSRLSELDIDTNAIHDAFKPLLTDVPAVSLPSSARSTVVDVVEAAIPRRNQRWVQAACILAAFGVGWFLNNVMRPEVTPSTNWQTAVAEYQRLYTKDTLSTGDPDPTQVEQQLNHVSATSGLTVTPDMVQIPELRFQRAQTLGLDEQPLIQLAFLTKDGTPVALCFMRDGSAAKARTNTQLLGLNSVTWSNGEFGFIIIGDVPPPLLEQSAQLMATRLL